PVPQARPLLGTQLVAREASNDDILAQARDALFDQVANGPAAVTNVRLIQQWAVVLACPVTGRRLVANARGAHRPDLQGDLWRQLSEPRRARHEVRLAIQLDQHAYAAAGVDVRFDEALPRLSTRLALGALNALSPQ